MQILGIAKLKCLNYIWRTFGVRNQLSSLVNNSKDAYLGRCKNFFRNWSVPVAHRDRMMTLFTGWADFVVSGGKSSVSKGKRSSGGRAVSSFESLDMLRSGRGDGYLAVLEDFLASDPVANLIAQFGSPDASETTEAAKQRRAQVLVVRPR